MNKKEIVELLRNVDSKEAENIFKTAAETKKRIFNNEVHLRAIVEISNYCHKNCSYCGLNATNKILKRYRMSLDDILFSVKKAVVFNFKTIILQSGEDPLLSSQFIENLIMQIKNNFDVALTLSLGERDISDYKRWRDLGADRYLLKFETSNPLLYDKLHPSSKGNLKNRLGKIKELKKLGYETGSGIMVGLPFQSYDSLAEDLLLINRLDLDMIAIGPYIPHRKTSLAKETHKIEIKNVEKTVLLMISLARIMNPTTNIPSTTALSVLDPLEGRAAGLRCGANVIMPDLTTEPYKSMYEIYDGKNKSNEWNNIEQQKLIDFLKFLGQKPSSTKGFRLK